MIKLVFRVGLIATFCLLVSNFVFTAEGGPFPAVGGAPSLQDFRDWLKDVALPNFDGYKDDIWDFFQDQDGVTLGIQKQQLIQSCTFLTSRLKEATGDLSSIKFEIGVSVRRAKKKRRRMIKEVEIKDFGYLDRLYSVRVLQNEDDDGGPLLRSLYVLAEWLPVYWLNSLDSGS
jgi:hypothetical protein